MNPHKIKIKNQIVSNDSKIFICAETGVTCNYDISISKELIDVVAESKADAIKFIFWFPDEIMSDKNVAYTYQTVYGEKTENMYNMLSKLQFSLEEWYELKEYADKKNIILFSTINSPSGIKYARALNLDAYKLSSWDFNYTDLWEELAKDQKPLIIDTGPVFKNELDDVMSILNRYNTPTILVHCFHTKNPIEFNMKTIKFLQQTYNSQVGFSSTDRSSECDILAVALGASFIEKRLTLSRSLKGHHHILSLEPKEFSEYVKMIRNCHKSLGKHDLIPSKNDLLEKKKYFRSLVLTKTITAGTIINKNMLSAKRPGTGFSPKDISLFLGKKVNKELKKNQQISLDDIEK